MSESPSDDSSPPPQSYRPTDSIADELSLSQGEVLRAGVVSKLPQDSGKLVITVRGNRVLAESSLDVKEGQVLLVRVKTLGTPIKLELIDPYDAPGDLRDADLRSFLDRTELPSSDEDLDLLREWLDQSLPLDRSLLEDVFADKSFVQDENNVPESNRLWSSAFLHDKGVTPTESLVSALAQARASDLESDLTLFYRTNEGSFQSIESGSDLSNAVQAVGFDLVRQMSRRPHRAAGTLHAQLLRKQKDTPNSSPRALHERLLGMILGVVFSNLRSASEFLMFLPITEGKSLSLFWLQGRVDQSEDTSWSVRGQLDFSSLGTIGFSVECKYKELDVSIRTSDQETIRLINERQSELRSKLMSHFTNVVIQILEEDPVEEFNPFKAESVAGEKSSQAFAAPGLDLTV